MNYKLSDFKVGQKAYIEIVNRGILSKDERIQECVVEKIKKLCVTAGGHRFSEHNLNYGGLQEHTVYKVTKVLYPTKQAVEDKLEKDELISTLKSVFTGVRTCKADELSLEKLRKISDILNS